MIRRHALRALSLLFASSLACDPAPGDILPAAEEPSATATATATTAATAPGAQWARYAVESAAGTVPKFDELRLVTWPSGRDGRPGTVWFRMEAAVEGEFRFAIAMLVPSLDFLSPPSATVSVNRYVFIPDEGRPIEYASRETGKAVLPWIGLFERLLPRLESFDAGRPFAAEGEWLGRPIERIDGGTDVEEETSRLGEVRRLELESEVLVGTARAFRDDGTPPKPTASDRVSRRFPDYEYVPLGSDDYRKMIDAGMNLFRVPLHHLEHVVSEPVWFILEDGFSEHPDILWRSNWIGTVQYIDEPAVQALHKRTFDDHRDPGEFATSLVDLVRRRLDADDKYGSRRLDRLLRESRFELGGGAIRETEYPTWEAAASSAWYQLEAGAGGFCYEARFRPKEFADKVASGLGVAFPPAPEPCIDLYLALFTGAARRFEKPWGVSIYGQMESSATDLLFPRAYDRGATYFWLWTSDRSHHVPFERQLELVRALREHARENPRPASAARVTASAGTAIAIPWGYPFDEYAFAGFRDRKAAALWGAPGLALDESNRAGAPYRDVLAVAMREAVRLLETGVPFDIVFPKAGEKVVGYEQVIRILETGAIRREGNARR